MPLIRHSLLLTLICGASPSLFGQVEFQGIGVLPGGPSYYSEAVAVSADGSVLVGRSLGSAGYQAIIWTTGNPSLQPIPFLPGGNASRATAISADGAVITGYGGSTDGSQAFRWSPGGTAPIALGDLDLDGPPYQSRGLGVSADGNVIVGRGASPAIGSWQAFRLDGPGTLPASGLALVDLTQGGFDCEAHAVSGDGTVAVGYSNGLNGSGSYAVAWVSGSPFAIDLGSLQQLAGDPVDRAHGVSFDGSVIVGNSQTGFGDEAFRWSGPGTIATLGTLGARPSSALGCSSDGSIVVGYSQGTTFTGDHAFIWDATNGMQDLHALVADAGVLPSGWTLRRARAVKITSSSIVVVGEGTSAAGIEGWRVVLPASSEPEFIRSDGNGDGVVDIADPIFALGFLFSGLSADCADALDANDDGAVDIADPIFVLAALFSGGTVPGAPYPSCGVDPTADAISCSGSAACP